MRTGEDFGGRPWQANPPGEDGRDYSARPGGSQVIDAKTLAAIDRASDLDRAWFARHSTRAYRLRPVVPGEFGTGTFPPGTQRLALVKQLLPGARTRLPFWAIRRPCSCDACLGEIWDAHAPPSLKCSMVELAATLMAARP